MALSLFGGKKHLHHFVAEQDVAKELFALLVEAKTMYLRDVVTGNKQVLPLRGGFRKQPPVYRL